MQINYWVKKEKEEWADYFEAFLFTLLYKISIIIINSLFMTEETKEYLIMIYNEWKKVNTYIWTTLIHEDNIGIIYMLHPCCGNICIKNMNKFNRFGLVKLIAEC